MTDQDYQKYATEKAKSRKITVNFRHDFYDDGVGRWHETLCAKTGKSIHKSSNAYSLCEAMDKFIKASKCSAS